MSSRAAACVAVAFALGLAAGLAARPSLALARGEKVVLENDKVRVVEFVLEPGAPMGMHDHPRDRVEITVSGGKVRVTTPDGRPRRPRRSRAAWSSARPARRATTWSTSDRASCAPTTSS